jgi:hypothetical protein
VERHQGPASSRARAAAAAALGTVYLVALSTWLGGILVFGAVTAPAVFGTARKLGQDHRGMPLWDFAGTAIGEGFRRFGYVAVAAGAVMLAAGAAYSSMTGRSRGSALAQAGLAGAAWAVALWLAFGLFPRMFDLRGQMQMHAFDALHHTASRALQVEALLLVGAAAVTAAAHLPARRPGN